MSLSKEVMGAGTEQPSPPGRKCNRCRHHGIIVPQKGHINQCPFTDCSCWKCHQITQRKLMAAVQRNVKKVQHGEQRPRLPAAVRAVKPAAKAKGAWCSSAAGGSTRPYRAMLPPSSGTTGGDMSGVDREVLPYASREEAPCTPSALYFGVFGQIPVIPFPLGLSGHHPRGYAPCVAPVLNMPWFPPVPAGLYCEGLHGALMFPRFQSGAVGYPPPPEHGPPAPPPRQEPPLVNDAEQDTEEVD